MTKNKQGFTLIELLVVIAIIGLLSTLSVLALGAARARARDAKRVADVNQIRTALEMYYNDMNDYPLTASVAPSTSTVQQGIYTTVGGVTNYYMKTIPTPPSVVDGGSCPAQSTTDGYTYARTAATGGAQATYTIKYCLGAANNDIPGNVLHTATPGGMK